MSQDSKFSSITKALGKLAIDADWAKQDLLSKYDFTTSIDMLSHIEPINMKESSGMNELIKVTIEKQSEVVSKQTEMINLQSETINQLSGLLGVQQKMIEDGRKDSIETRIYSIISILLAIIAIAISIVLGR